jgi:hypothetical protein
MPLFLVRLLCGEGFNLTSFASRGCAATGYHHNAPRRKAATRPAALQPWDVRKRVASGFPRVPDLRPFSEKPRLMWEFRREESGRVFLAEPPKTATNRCRAIRLTDCKRRLLVVRLKKKL